LPESLQVNTEDRRCSIDFKNLGGLNMLFAFTAIPLVVFIKKFWLLEFLKAVVDCDIFFILFFHGTIPLPINSDAFINTTKMSLHILSKISMPNNIQHDVISSTVVIIEADIVLDTDLLKHLENSSGVYVWQWAILMTL